MDYRIGLVGTGRLGRALAGELFQRGHHLAAVVGRDLLRAQEWAGHYGSIAVTQDDVAAKIDLLLLVTPDDALEHVANALSQYGDWHGKIVLHASGSLDSSVLLPLEKAGASVGSMHPLYSFTGDPEVPSGIYFGIEGSAPAQKAAERLVDFFAGIAFRLTPGTKALYHAAACIASNFMVTLADAAGLAMAAAGLPQESAVKSIMPLMTGVLRNIHAKGTEGALTGPIIRGDVKTLERHLDAFRMISPDLLPLYLELAEQTLALALRAGLPESKGVELGDLFKQESVAELSRVKE